MKIVLNLFVYIILINDTFAAALIPPYDDAIIKYRGPEKISESEQPYYGWLSPCKAIYNGNWDSSSGVLTNMVAAVSTECSMAEITSNDAAYCVFVPPQSGDYQVTFTFDVSSQILSVNESGFMDYFHGSTFDIKLIAGWYDSSGGRPICCDYPEFSIYGVAERFADALDSYEQTELNALMGEIISCSSDTIAKALTEPFRTYTDKIRPYSKSGSLTVNGCLVAGQAYEFRLTVSAMCNSSSVSIVGGNIADANTVVKIKSIDVTMPPPPPPPSVPTPVILVEETSGVANDDIISFGDVHLGCQASTELSIANTGTSDLALYSWTSSNSAFTLSPSGPPVSQLGPWESTQITVGFAPTAIGTFSGTIMIYTNDPQRPIYSLSVSGAGQNRAPNVAIPVRDFTSWVGKVVDFNAVAIDPDGDAIEAYEWDFGDGQTSNEASPSHIYYWPSTYTVQFRAKDTLGAWSQWISVDVPVKKQRINAIIIGQKNICPITTAYHLNAKDIADSLASMDGRVTFFEIDASANSWKQNGVLQSAPFTKTLLENSIADALDGLESDDLFVFVYIGRGTFNSDGSESPVDIYSSTGQLIAAQNKGDEILDITDSVKLSDNNLAQDLNGYDAVPKLVVLGCSHSMGFWGGGNSDQNDLVSVSNIALLADTPESNTAVAVFTDDAAPQNLLGMYFAEALRCNGGWAKADVDANGLTCDEMLQFVKEYANTAWPKICDMNNPLIQVISPIPQPILYKSADFSGEVLLKGPSIYGSLSGTIWRDLNCNGVRDPEDVNGQSGSRVFVDYYGNASPNAYSILAFSTDTPKVISIPHNTQGCCPETTVSSSVSISGIKRIEGIRVKVSISPLEEYVYNHISVSLVTPMGKTALIASGLGISPFGVINLDTTDISSAAIGSLLDENPNGTWTLNVTDGSWLFDGRDARLDSWSLEITELEPFGISDDDGSYFVAGIDPSTYQVRQVAARGCVETFPGTSIYSEAFSRGQTISGIDFGVSPPGEIHGRLWRDVNKNGVWDAGEQALEGFTVFIDDNNNHNLDAGEEYQITDASGRYAFEDLAPGQYTITVADKAGWQATYPNISATQTLNLAVGQNVAGVDFGFVPPGSVYGTIYNDSNNNGQFDPGENPISGWMVYIDYNGNGTYDYGEPLAYSDNNGYYCINDIPANSSVSVREVCQVGWKPSNPAGGQTTIFVGADSANSANFGNSENPLTIFVTAQYNSPDPAADGSVEHPFASITQGVNTVQDGGTVIIGPGDYMENVEVRRSNITIIGAGAKSTIIYPGNSGSTMLLNGNNITLRGLRINDNPLLDNTQYIGVEIDQCDNITLQRCAIVGQTSYGVFIYGSSESTPSIKFVNCTISGNQGDHQIQVQPSDITDNGYFYIYPNITFINTIVAGGSEPFYCYGNDNACGGQVNMITSWVNKGDPGFMPGKCTILGPNSPCIDAGTWIGDEDYDGELPWDDPLVPNTGSGKFTYQDIGVDEFVDRNLDGNPDADGLFVSGTQVNGGLSVHSYVNQVSITFSSVLTKYSMDNVTLKYPDGTYILLNTLPVQFDSVRSILTIDMSTLHLGTGIYEIDFPSADFMDYLGQMLGAGDAAFIAGACSASFMVLEGDTDGDGQVTSYDLLAVKKCIGTRQGDVGYDANCDLNGDGIIDMSDLAIVRSNMGHSLLPPPSTQVDLDSNKVDDSGRLMYFTHDIGELQTYHIKVGNCGGSALTIGGIDIEGDGSGDFNYVWMGKTQGTTSGILQANEVADLAVTFTGSHLGDSNATLSFVHNAFNIPNPYSIALTGHVLIPGSLSWSAVGGSFWAQIGIEDDQMGIGDEQDGGGGEVSDGQWQTSNLYPLNDVSTGLMMGPTGNSVASFIQLWYLNDTLTSPEFKAAGCSTTNGADNTFSYSELNLNSLNFLLSGTGEEVYTLTVDKNVNDNDIMLAPFFPEDQGISDCSVQLNSVTLNLKPSSQEGIYTATFIGHPGDVLSLSGQLYTETNQKAEIAIKVLYPNQKNQILNSTFDDSDLDGWNYFFGSVDFVPSDNGMSLHTNDGAGIYYYFPTPLPEGTYELSFECMGSVDSIGIGYNWNWWFGQGGIGTGEQLDNGWSRYSIQFSDSVSSIQLYMEGWDPNVFIDNICLYSVEQQQQMQSRFIRLSSTPQNTLYGDINSDGLVDFGDLGQLASSWLKNDPTTDIAPSPNGDGIVNFRDFAEMAKNWMK